MDRAREPTAKLEQTSDSGVDHRLLFARFLQITDSLKSTREREREERSYDFGTVYLLVIPPRQSGQPITVFNHPPLALFILTFSASSSALP
jgi:hypothetical protein